MKGNILGSILIAAALAIGANAQPPGGGLGVPGGQPGMPEGPGGMRSPGGLGGQQRDWFKGLDTNNDGGIDNSELQFAIDRTFTELDKNNNGTIDSDEFRPGPPPPNGGGVMERGQGRPDGGRRPQGGDRPSGPGKDLLPPFFFDRQLRNGTMNKTEFAAAVREVFNDLDKNKDGLLTREEARPPKHQDENNGGGPGGPPPPPNAQFIAAELRFGDKLIAGHPFSADTVLQDTRRLYDGTTVTKSMTGAFYRNTAGSTRREQPLEMIGGVQVAGTDGKPQTMVFINDFSAKTQTFLDVNNKIARTHPLGDGPRPQGPGVPAARDQEKTESLGTKVIEGVKAEGTRITFEIPAGHLGNDKPIEVVTENWFSPELGVMVMSRHLDPIAGEHVFRLTNIRLGEPSADLFSVPAGYRIDNAGARNPREE